MIIIETTGNQLFSVRDAGADYPQAWVGIAVKKSAGSFVPKAGAKDILVRKAGSRIVAQA